MAALKTVDPSIRTLALTNHSVYLKAAISVTHKRAAGLLGISPATQSEWTSEQMERACQTLAAFGLAVVDKRAGFVPPDQMRAFVTLAAAHMERIQMETAPLEQDSQPAALDE